MIVADTSVLIEADRGRQPETGLFTSLVRRGEIALAAPVRVEYLGGASRSALPRLLLLCDSLRIYEPTHATWAIIDEWLYRAVAAGERFAAVDLLVAALAAEKKEPVWSLDADFVRMSRLGFVDLYGVQ